MYSSVEEQMLVEWKSVYGQKPSKEILSKLLISSKIPHAFLFNGQDGVGKYFISLRFAQLIKFR